MSNSIAPDDVLVRLGIGSPKEIVIEEIAQYCGATVLYEELHGCAARVVGHGDRAIISVDTTANRSRQRFSAGHDRGHLEAVLEKLNGVEQTGDGEWEWREGVGAECRVVAELGFEQEFLIVSAKKEADLKRCSSRLQVAAGRAVEHRIGEERFEIRYPNGSTEIGSSGIFS